MHSYRSLSYRRGAIRAASVFLVILWPVCAANVATVRGSLQKVDEAARLIKEVAQEEAADPDSPIVIKPFFLSGKKNGVSWIDYDLGGVAVDNMGLPPGDSYRVPYVMQIQVEALKKVFEANVGGMNFWRPHLEQAERLVRQTVEVIESTPDRKKLDDKLSEKSRAFQSTLDALESSIKSYAVSQKLQIGEPGVGRRSRFGEPEPYSVKVLTEPEGGKVRVVTAFVWRTCLKKGCDKGQLIWRSLNVGETEGLIGGYHYIAEWRDGGKDEDDMKIDRDQERKFRPFGRQ